MANLYITEYSSPNDFNKDGSLELAQEPATAEQKVSYTTATQSAAFNSATSVVRLIADADVWIAFGSNPTADATSQYVPANVEVWRRVVKGASHKVSAYDGTS